MAWCQAIALPRSDRMQQSTCNLLQLFRLVHIDTLHADRTIAQGLVWRFEVVYICKWWMVVVRLCRCELREWHFSWVATLVANEDKPVSAKRMLVLAIAEGGSR